MWQRKCPRCETLLTKPHPLDQWECHKCGWPRSEPYFKRAMRVKETEADEAKS